MSEYLGQTSYKQMANMNAPTATDPPIESPSVIRDGLSSSEQWLSEVHSAIHQLEQRLDTVLTPEPPSKPAGNAVGASPVASHVTGRLLILNEGWRDAVTRLQRLVGRIEI